MEKIEHGVEYYDVHALIEKLRLVIRVTTPPFSEDRGAISRGAAAFKKKRRGRVYI